MKQQPNLRERYIQLVETFISAIESGKTGTELENIRKEIRMLSIQFSNNSSVENHTQEFQLAPVNLQNDKKHNDTDSAFS